MRSAQSFTIVELLVVTAVMTILVSMLLPALQVARCKARRAACVNNLRQIGIAAQNYREDQDDWIPASVAHADSATRREESGSFTRYCGDQNILVCPEDRATQGVSYGRNANITKACFKSLGEGYDHVMFVLDANVARPHRFDEVAYRHVGMANALYFDTHVETVYYDGAKIFTREWLPPGNVLGKGFLIRVRARQERWDQMAVSVLQGDSPVQDGTIIINTDDPGKWEELDVGLVIVNPYEHTCKLRFTGSYGGPKKLHAKVGYSINGGDWVNVSKPVMDKPGSNPLEVDITAALKAAMPGG